jgi:hypothetical protein
MRWRRQIGAEPYPFGPLPKRKRHHERFWRIVQRILAETLAMTSIYRKPAPHANTAIEVSVNAGEVRDQTLGRLEFWTLRLQRDRVGGGRPPHGVRVISANGTRVPVRWTSRRCLCPKCGGLCRYIYSPRKRCCCLDWASRHLQSVPGVHRVLRVRRDLAGLSEIGWRSVRHRI